MTKQVLTDDERIRRVWDVLEIKNLMGRHAYYHAYDMHAEELAELWVQKPGNQKTASFGQNWGYQVGINIIRKNYVDLNIKWHQEDLNELCDADPTLENCPENLGIGCMLMHALSTPYIEIAGDGQTAQGMWYSPGQVTFVYPDKVNALWMYEKYAVDFIKEDDEWKIWHLFVGTDFALEAGEDMTKQPVSDTSVDDKAPEGMEITIPIQAYTARYNWSAYPAIPRPYETFSETISNGPDGHPKLRKGGEDE